MGFFNIFRNEEELGYYRGSIPDHYLGKYWERKYKDQMGRVILTAFILIIGMFFIFSHDKPSKDAKFNTKIHPNTTWDTTGTIGRRSNVQHPR